MFRPVVGSSGGGGGTNTSGPLTLTPWPGVAWNSGDAGPYGPTGDTSCVASQNQFCLSISQSGCSLSVSNSGPSPGSSPNSGNYALAASNPGSSPVSYTYTSTGGTGCAGSVTETIWPSGYYAKAGATGTVGACSFAAPCSIANLTATLQNASIKYGYLLNTGGVYTSLTSTSCGDGANSASAVVVLGASDSNETWQFYPPEGYNSATLDAGGNVCVFDVEGGSSPSNVTVNGLKMQNATRMGFVAFGGQNLTIENSEFSQTSQDPALNESSAAIMLGCGGNGQTTWGGLTVLHNYVHDQFQNGLRLQDGGNANNPPQCGTGTPYSVTIGWNYFQNVCEEGSDCGAWYFNSDQAPSSGPILVEYNYTKDINKSNQVWGSQSKSESGTYFDGANDNFTVKGNIVASPGVIACWGQDGYGSVTFQYNICDQETVGNTGFTECWGLDTGSQVQSGAYQGSDQWIDGINILNNSSGIPCGWDDEVSFSPGSPPAVNGNLYYNYASPSSQPSDSCAPNQCTSTLGGSANVSADPNPIFQNPNFICGWTYTLTSTSTPISFPQPANDLGIAWGKPGYWGPPGFAVPHTGTTPSPSTSGC